MRLAGFDFSSSEQYQQDLTNYANSGAWGAAEPAAPPMAARPIYVDDAGNHFIGSPGDDGVAMQPFSPTEPATTHEDAWNHGGFLPVERPVPLPGGAPMGGGGGPWSFSEDGFPRDFGAPDDDFDLTSPLLYPGTPGWNPNAGYPGAANAGPGATQESDPVDIIRGVVSGIPQNVAQNWLAQAATAAITGAAPGGSLDAVLSELGVQNPLAGGPIGDALQGALAQSGLGELGSLMPSLGNILSGDSTAGLADALGQSTSCPNAPTSCIFPEKRGDYSLLMARLTVGFGFVNPESQFNYIGLVHWPSFTSWIGVSRVLRWQRPLTQSRADARKPSVVAQQRWAPGAQK